MANRGSIFHPASIPRGAPPSRDHQSVLHGEHPGEEGPCKTAEMISARLSDEMAARATLLAMCVRNAIEGTVHGGELGQASLTDEQLAALNPIVRNAIATGLHAESQYFKE